MTRDGAMSGDAVFEQLTIFRQNLVERMWRAFFLLALVILPMLAWHSLDVGVSGLSAVWGVNLVFMAAAACILLAFPARQKIPFAVRAAMPIVVLSVVGMASLLVFGAASTAFVWLVQSNFLLSTLYSLRAGIIATVVTALMASAVGVLFLTGVLVNSIDLNTYFLLPSSWILFLIGTTVVPTVILYSIGGYQKTIGELLTTVQAKRDKLSAMSTQLSEALRAEERANAAKSEFLAHMTHELRTPLSGVIGLLEIVDSRNRDPKLGHLLTVSRQNAESLLKIINDVLDFSKIEAGKVTLDPEYFDLNDFISTSMEVFTLRADEKNIRFGCHVDASLTSVRYADPMRIRQVLFNLISNAIKFTSAGRVDLEVKPAFPEQPDDCRVLFMVRDTGVGIPPQAMARLFQEFEQADSSVQKRFGGTGLGLAISKMLVDAMGGTIQVHSREGEGASFHVILPLPMGPQKAVSQAPMSPPATESKTHAYQLNILLAEDTPTNQLVARTLLEDMGHRVSLVETGLAAVKAMAQENFDLILMDLRMPELGGCEATTMIRGGGTKEAHVSDRDVFICAMTANATPQDREKAREVDMNDFLTKPVRSVELFALIQRAIDFQLARGIALMPALEFDSVDLTQFDALLEASAPTPRQRAAKAPRGEEDMVTRAATLRAVFAQDLHGHRARLKETSSRSDWAAVREIAHAVCGAASAVTLDLCSETARQLENACKAQDEGQCALLADRLMALMAEFLGDEA